MSGRGGSDRTSLDMAGLSHAGGDLDRRRASRSDDLAERYCDAGAGGQEVPLVSQIRPSAAERRPGAGSVRGPQPSQDQSTSEA